MNKVVGLSDDEQRTLDRLVAQLDSHAVRNELRRAHMDAKALVRRLPPTLPPYLRNVGMVLGWPTKAVEAVARRTRLTGFSVLGADPASFGINSILDENDYLFESRQAQLSSLESGVSWQIATRGLPGEPEAMVTRQDALNGTGEWSRRARRLTSFLSVIERGEDGNPSEFNLYLPGVTVVCEGRRVVDRVPSLPHVPVEPLVYRQRDARPFGSSRISRPIMAITHSAVRTILRSEGTADFYGAPLLALFGPDESFFKQNPALKLLLSSMFAISDNPDADPGNERADIKQFAQASQEPHIKQLEVWAQLFASEANIPVSSLGIGMTQANPTSAESYLASREDLIAEAEDAQDGWSRPHVRTLLNAWMMREGVTELPDELLKLRPIWRDARHDSKAASGDWFMKVASVMPWMAESDAALDLIGLDEDTAERLRDDKRRAQGRAAYALLGADNAPV